MAYSDFKLNEMVKIFDLTIREISDLFITVPEVECSEHLMTTLHETVDLAVAINTEKARSEMIIAPVLLELRRQLKRVVTIGTIWRFLRLTGKTVEIDLSEYYIKDIKKILGILYHAIMKKERGG